MRQFIIISLACAITNINGAKDGKQTVRRLLNEQIPFPDGPQFELQSLYRELPGVYFLNKIYNFLDGTDLSEKNGRDYFQFRWSSLGRSTSSLTQFSVPFDLQSIPNIVPTCSHEEKEITYKLVKNNLLNENTHGFEYDFIDFGELNEEEIKDAVIALLNSNTRRINEGRERKLEGYKEMIEKSMDSLSLYETAVNLNYLNHFQISEYLQYDLSNLNNNINNKAIMNFIHNWGTHVISHAKFGGECKSYHFSDDNGTTKVTQICDGDIPVYNDGKEILINCDSYLSHVDNNHPIPIEYQILPIWSLQLDNNILTDTIKNELKQFIYNIFIALNNCKNERCNGNGLCSLRNDLFTYSFINNKWDGEHFSQFIDTNKKCIY